MNNVSLILLDIRSAHNVGSIMRTADAVGISHVYLVGVTPTPLDRFGKVEKNIAKVALGAEKNIPWERVEKVESLLKKLKKDGVEIIALEQNKKSVDYKKVLLKNKKGTAIILGSEVEGIQQKILKKCDKIIEIPMRGKKESLNVSVAAGIALFRILNI